MGKNERKRYATVRLVWSTVVLAAFAHVPMRAQSQEIVLHNFGSLPAGAKGANPYAGVVRDAAGNLYGTTVNGGSSNDGAVYKIDTAGHEEVLYSFTGGQFAPDGANPYAGVILDSDGNLYGTTPGVGGADAGVAYKVDTNGQETVLYHFCQQNNCVDGATPSSGLVRDSAGNVYGTTAHGGTANAGVVYKIDPAGGETVLYSFTGGADGSGPNSLILDDASDLYGTTAGGGLGKQGVVFKVDMAGQESVVYYFGPDDGVTPVGVKRDADGNLYGATAAGGVGNAGIVFKIDAAGREQILYSFRGGSDGGNPGAGVVFDEAGNLFGTTTHGGSSSAGVVYKVDTAGQETVLYAFNGSGGSSPVSGVIFDAAGNLYGTTPSPNLGVVYKIDRAGHETVLTGFAPTAPPDGASPYGNLTIAGAGELYGTTANGGAAGFGTVYKLDTPGRETVVYDFTGGASGAYPSGGVVFDTAGNLYGTAEGGSANQGVVYKLDTGGQETVLYSFTGGADGGEPSAGLVMDAEGNLYGATAIGGFGHGVVYKLDATGQETVLHNFGGASFGDYPLGVTRDAAGNLYGTTFYGGVANVGIAYKVNAAGRFTILHSFTGLADGAYPNGGLVLDDLGNLYGTAQGGGAYGLGVVFRLDPAGEETVLYNFCSQPNCADGAAPGSGVVRDAAGNLYGTASDEYGYYFGPGVVYMLDGAGQETVLWTFSQTDGSIPNGVIRDEAGNLFGTTVYGGTKSSGVVFKITLP